MFYSGVNVKRLSLRTYFTEYFYNYFNRDLTPNIHDSSFSNSVGADAVYRIGENAYGASIIEDRATGDKIGVHKRTRAGVFYSFEKNGYYFDAKISSKPQTEFLAAKSFEFRSCVINGGVKRRYREPTFNELYWSNDLFAHGNENLESELLHSLFLSAERTNKIYSTKIESGVNFFNNLIEWVNDGVIYTPVNVKKALNPYLKIEGDLNRGNLHIFNAFSYSPFIDINNYKIIPYKPIFSYTMSADYDFYGLTSYLGISFKSKRYITTSNTKYLPDIFIIERIGALKKYGSLIFGAECLNPMNINIEDIRGYPVEGRKFNFYIKTEVL